MLSPARPFIGALAVPIHGITQEGRKVSKEQAWFLEQSYSFQVGFQDFRGGEQFDSRRNAEWQRGWKWANCKGVSRHR